jgi:drug/metabolite transporter (DMT)-like permease
MSRRISSTVALATGVVAFSTSGVLTKLCGAPAITTAFWVRMFSLAYLAAAFLAQNRGSARASLARALRHGLTAGIVFGVHILLYFWALKLTSVTVVFLLGALNPAVVGLFGWFFLDETPSRRQAFWTAVAIGAAVFVVVGRDATGDTKLLGNAIALVSALAYCGYFLLSRHARRSIGTTEFLMVTTAVSTIVVGAAALVGRVSLRVAPGHDLWMMALLGLVPGTIGHLTVSWALRHVEAHAASTVLLAVPLLASLWAYAIIGERVAVGQIVAGAIVLLAIPGAIRRPDVPPAYEAVPAPIAPPLRNER